MKNLRNDIILIVSILIIAIVGIICFRACSSKENLKAIVYYNDEVILELKLDKEASYTVNGKEGELVILTGVNEVSIKESNCSDKICIHQGKAKSTNQTITCLPNRIYIKVVGSNEGADASL